MRTLLLTVAAVVPVLDLVFAQPPAAAGKKYALLVGVNEYDHRQLANLKYAERDVTKLSEVLKDNGFEVTLLLGSSSGDNKATRANIEKAVADLLGKVTKKDTLLTAFAGHGEQFKPDGAGEEQPFFCPSDAKPNDAKRLYPFNDLLKKLDKDGAGTNLVLVDACRSVNDANRGTRSGIDGTKAVSLAVGTVVFFACSRDQEARETEKANGGHGVFFHHVIDGLKGNAANKRGQVTWDGLVAHVKDQTAAAYPDWFPGLPERKWQQPQSIGNTSGAVVLVSGDLAKKPPAADGGKEYTSKTTGMKFVRIKADKFMMGSLKEETGRSDDEDQHEVTLTKDYYLGVHEVTRGQFREFVEADGYKTEGEADGKGGSGWDATAKKFKTDAMFTWKNTGFAQTDDHPVVLVSWNDAVAYCKWLSQKDRKTYRLPSEAEWEYACRAGSQKRYAFGDDDEDLAKHGNVADADFSAATGINFGIKASDKFAFTAPVGSFPKNRFEIADMHGNVWEWCADYSGPYNSLASNTDPLQNVDQLNGRRVCRGGSWGTYAKSQRAAYRFRNAPDFHSTAGGFRLCFHPD